MKTNPLSPEEDRARRAVLAIARHRGLRGADLARSTGLIPMSISQRLNGKTVIGITDLHRFAEALGVEPYVLLMEPDDAVRWVLDNAPTFAGERGIAELPFVLTVVGAAVVSWAGARFPELAMWVAENQREDKVMSSDSRNSTLRGRGPAFCVMNPTPGAITVYRPHTVRAGRTRCNLYMQRGDHAVECVASR